MKGHVTQRLAFRNRTPREGAALLRYRATLLLERQEVYVVPHTRGWPGGIAAARKAIEKRRLAAGPKRLPIRT